MLFKLLSNVIFDIESIKYIMMNEKDRKSF